MRVTTPALLIAATVVTSLAAAQPTQALTADEKREKTRLSKAQGVSLIREAAKRKTAYAEKCEAAFESGEPMPDLDFYIKEEIGIDDDLMVMVFDDILEESARASDAERASEKAWKACVLKYRKKGSGS